MDHGALFYLLPWIVTLALALSVLRFLVESPFFSALVDRRERGRDTRFPRSFRLGGAALIVVFLGVLLGDPRFVWDSAFIALLIGSLAVFFFSLADDFLPLPWPWHLAFQISLAGLVFAAGMQIDLSAYSHWLPTVSLPLGVSLVAGVIWMVLIMNALNWADGTDGLMPGVAALSFLTIFILSLRPEVNQPTVGILSVMLLALALALLFFNWHPAKILAGTGGAYFFGFALATLAIYAGTKVATILLVLAIPVFDALYVCFRRLSAGRSLFQPDQEHLHHLLARAGWSPRRIALSYIVLTAMMALLALSLREAGKAATFISAGIFLAVASLMLSLWLRFREQKI